jgi:hypothetical protein
MVLPILGFSNLFENFLVACFNGPGVIERFLSSSGNQVLTKPERGVNEKFSKKVKQNPGSARLYFRRQDKTATE